MDKVVIVMPAWNEAKNIEKMVGTLTKEVFPDIKGVDVELLVVDNNSTDGTTEIVEKAAKTNSKVHIIQQGSKSGLGWAYVAGINHAIKKLNADAVMEMDADGQHPPRFVKPMIEAYLDGADYVVGSRYVDGGSVPEEWAFTRKFVSYFGNLYIRLVWLNFKIHDVTTGFRLTRVKGVLEKIKLESLMELKRFAYKMDLFYRTLKLSKKTVEVPLEFRPRTEEKSKFNFKEMIASYKVATYLGIMDKIKIIKFGIVGFAGFLVNFAFIRIFRGIGLAEVLTWLFATELAIANNYIFNNIWTFKAEKISGVKAHINKFFQFNLTSAGALIIQSILGPLGVRIFGAEYDYLVLAVIVLFIVFPYNYIMANVVIWKTWKLPKIFSRKK